MQTIKGIEDCYNCQHYGKDCAGNKPEKQCLALWELSDESASNEAGIFYDNY
jgi:hypothetical protein